MKKLDIFFEPKSVAVIGASHEKGSVGYSVSNNLINGSFNGKIYLINPKCEEILGKKCYASVSDIKENIDVAIVTVPAKIVPKIMEECVGKGIKGAVIISSGFSETGNHELARKVIEIAKDRIMVIGPNCIGVYNPDSGMDTNFLSKERLKRPLSGSIGFISQSGAIGSAMLDWLSKENIGISKFVSYGNAMDVDESDLIEYFNNDESTKVITMYLEGSKNGRKFIKTLKNLKKPLVVLKAGRTKKGIKAVSSHTGSLAGEARIYSGIFNQFNVIEAESWEELFDIAKGFAFQPRPCGRKLAIITDGGGFGVMATDEAEKRKLILKDPSDKLKKLFKGFPHYVIINDPIDLTGDATSKRYETAIDACLNSGEYDGVVAILVFQVPTLNEDVVDKIAELKKYKKPIICCSTGGSFTSRLVKKLESKSIPVYKTPGRAVRVFAAMIKE